MVTQQRSQVTLVFHFPQTHIFLSSQLNDAHTLALNFSLHFFFCSEGTHQHTHEGRVKNRQLSTHSTFRKVSENYVNTESECCPPSNVCWYFTRRAKQSARECFGSRNVEKRKIRSREAKLRLAS